MVFRRALAIKTLQASTFSEANTAVVGYVFIRYSDTNKTARHILASLLSQVLQASRGARALVKAAFLRSRRAHETLLSQREIADLLSLSMKSLRKVFIIVNGLDEASGIRANTNIAVTNTDFTSVLAAD